MNGIQSSEIDTTCLSCGARAIALHSRGALQHCFGCGRDVPLAPAGGAQTVMRQIADTCRQALAANQTVLGHLTSERGLHPQVLRDSMIGVVPAELDVAALFAPAVLELTGEIERLEAEPRGPGRLPKNHPLSVARDRLAATIANRDQLAAAFEDRAGAIAFFYTDADHAIVRITFLDLASGAVTAGYGGGGLFNHQLFAPKPRAATTKALRPGLWLVPTEWDALQVQSFAARLAEEEGLPPQAGYLWVGALGTTGRLGTGTVRCLSRVPNYIYGWTQPESDRLLEELRQARTVDGFAVPGSSAGEWFRTADAAAVRRVLGTPRRFTRPYEAVRGEMDRIRQAENEPLKPFEVNRDASRVLIRDLEERGRLFFDGRDAYAYVPEDARVYPIDLDDQDTQALLRRYGISPRDSFCKPAHVELRLHAQTAGTQAKVQSLAHYDAEADRVYLFDQDQRVYGITPEKVDVVANGTDGVLFRRNPKWEALSADFAHAGSWSPAELLHGIRLSEAWLTRQQQALLLELWLLTVFFPELFPTRPILAAVGPKGSGKTSLVRAVGRLLFGSGFQVVDVSGDPKDFDAAVTADAYVAIDNADRPITWLDDKLAILATGGTLKRRRYYTTNNLVEYPVIASVAVTSRTPHFRREDVADRLLLFEVDRLEQFAAESGRLRNFAERRSAAVGWLIRRIQQALGDLRDLQNESFQTEFRTADFADFALRVTRSTGQQDEVRRILAALSEQQVAFAVQDEVLFDLLDTWLEQPENLGREVTSKELFEELRDSVGLTCPSPPFEFKTVKALGHRLGEFASTLKTLYGAERRAKRSHATAWVFAHPRRTELRLVS